MVLADFSLVRGGINFVMVRNGSLTEILLYGLELVYDGFHHLIVVVNEGL